MRGQVAVIEDAARARAVLPPLRQQILAAAHEPCSSTAIAASLGLPRQRVNYHVRALAAAGFLRRAGRRQRRGLVEQRWVATADRVIVTPRLDAAIAADHRTLGPDLGATYLLALAGTVQREVAAGTRATSRRGAKLPTLALDAELRFESAAQRARFAAAIQQAIAAAIAAHTTAAAAGPTFRLALGVYPVMEEMKGVSDDKKASRPVRRSRHHDRRTRR